MLGVELMKVIPSLKEPHIKLAKNLITRHVLTSSCAETTSLAGAYCLGWWPGSMKHLIYSDANSQYYSHQSNQTG
jgi:hypothetical protein